MAYNHRPVRRALAILAFLSFLAPLVPAAPKACAMSCANTTSCCCKRASGADQHVTLASGARCPCSAVAAHAATPAPPPVEIARIAGTRLAPLEGGAVSATGDGARPAWSPRAPPPSSAA